MWAQKLVLSGPLLPFINRAVLFKVSLVMIHVRTEASLLQFLQGSMWNRTNRKLIAQF
jgi:hypothetical protein